MDEFVGIEEDWGLEAVVRRRRSSSSSCSHGLLMSEITNNPEKSCFLPSYYDEDLDELSFSPTVPDQFEITATSFLTNELEESYKPFYPILNPNYSSSTTIMITPSISPPEEVAQSIQEKKKRKQQPDSSSNKSPAPSVKYKKRSRKNQQKRVVVQLTGEELSTSDMWAWRKYGQKPIKGSPYPRSYYRCSSSKGCLARKQVEQNCTDPGTFTVTYTGEHSHSHPTRRNSLAGITRQKFPARKTPDNSVAGDLDREHTKRRTYSPKSTSSSSSPLSPTTPPVIKQEILNRDEEEQMVDAEESVHDEFSIADMMLSDDDLFVGLDDLLTDSDFVSDCWDAGKRFTATLCS